MQFGNIFAFSIVVETVFQWPGLGLLVIQSIQFADVPLLAAYLVMIALGFAALNLGIDLLYAAIDPRVRAGMISARARA
jgi:peptide/nickel transport system permease protein